MYRIKNDHNINKENSLEPTNNSHSKEYYLGKFLNIIILEDIKQ
jgi:hypothetical protein